MMATATALSAMIVSLSCDINSDTHACLFQHNWRGRRRWARTSAVYKRKYCLGV
jgi:hypothetical protein